MSTKTKKIIFFSLLVIIAVGTGIAYYMYNKGPLSVNDEKGIAVEAALLYQAFLKDSVQAGKTYSGRVVESGGIVASVSENQQNQVVLLLQTNEAGAFINCTMEGGAGTIKKDQKVTIKGICTGMGAGDADLGIAGDVYLIRCYFVH